MRDLGSRRLTSMSLPWVSGLFDQGLWSVTNFALTVAAARTTGPSGLGAVAVGLATVLLAVGLQRSLVLDPFLASGRRVTQESGGRSVLTLSLGCGAVAAIATTLVGWAVGGLVGTGLGAFAPFLLPVLLQDTLRAVAYRADRVPSAAASRMIWMTTTVAALITGLHGSVGAVVIAWGFGSIPAAAFLAWQLGCLPAPPRAAVALWRRELWKLAGPLGLASVIDGAASQVETYLAALVAGVAELGGFRAAVSVFAPLTVLRPAIGQVGLPRVAKDMEQGPRFALRRAALLSVVLILAAVLYAGAAATYGRVLPAVFGASFTQYSRLLLPLTVGQVISAAAVGIHLYLLAAGRGGVLLGGTAVGVSLRMAATAFLGARFGAMGLAWSMAVAAGAGLVVIWGAVVHELRHRIPSHTTTGVRSRVPDRVRYLTSQPAFQAEPFRVLMRLGWWFVRSRLPRYATLQLQPWQVTIDLPPRWRGVSKLAYVFRHRYEPELSIVERFLSPGAVAVDVGANYGIYTLVMARLVGADGLVIALEPAAEAFGVLERNVRRNSLTNCSLVNAAALDRNGKLPLIHHPDPSRNALDLGGRTGQEWVSTVRLDDVLGSRQRRRVALVKVDVEGAEELVLRGAERVLAESRPVFILEVNVEGASRLGLRPYGACDLLAAHGYRFFQWQSGGFFEVVELLRGGNIVALPREVLRSFKLE